MTYTQARRMVRAVLRCSPDTDREVAAWAGLHTALGKHDPERGPMTVSFLRAHVRWSLGVAARRAARHPEPDLDLSRDLAAAWSRLTPREAEAARLCLIEGLMQTEAARIMGVTSPRVNALVSAARTRLQRSLRATYAQDSDQ